MTITVIADDLTGACDAGACFAGRGRVGVFVDAASVDARREVASIDTDSRALPPAAAADRVRRAARDLKARLGQGLVFKKIDSTLRGPVAAEIEALLDESGRPAALVCSAFPQQGRTVAGGWLHVDGRPAHTTAIAADPAYPGDLSDVAAILRRTARRPVRHLPLARVRGGGSGLRQALADGEVIVTADAERDADLDALASAALAEPDLVLAGSAGLARAVSAQLGWAEPSACVPGSGAWLVIAGSLHPVTRAQVRALRAAGVTFAEIGGVAAPDLDRLAAALAERRPALLTTAEPAAPAAAGRHAAARALAAAAAAVVAIARPDGIAATGGDTARAVMAALGADRIELAGAPAPGLALGELVTPRMTIPWFSKAGGFGAPDLWLTLLGDCAR